jgi:hypothetical protein
VPAVCQCSPFLEGGEDWSIPAVYRFHMQLPIEIPIGEITRKIVIKKKGQYKTHKVRFHLIVKRRGAGMITFPDKKCLPAPR